MTYRLPVKDMVSSLPLPLPNPVVPKVLYSLFEKWESKWVRISDISYSNERTAYHVFQDRVMDAPLHRQIRPIKVELNGCNLRFNR